jgi:phosphoglycolate phosphatase
MGLANRELRAVLFDIDNTLVNLFELHEQSYATTFAVIFGISAGIGDIRFSGKTTPNILREVGLLHGLERDYIETRLSSASEYLAELTRLKLEGLGSKVTQYILPGAVEVLEALTKQKLILGVLSGNPTKQGQIVLEVTGLKPYFSLFTFGDEANSRPELAKLSLAKLQNLTGLSAEQVLIIGDAVGDVEAAQAIGAVSVAVATGFHSVAELVEAKPDFVYANLITFKQGFCQVGLFETG